MNFEEKEQKFSLKSLLSGVGNVFVVFIFLYLFFVIGQLMWRNYQINKKIDQINQEIEIAQIQNELLEELLTYYQSDRYKEIEIRRRMLLKKPGEKVILLPVRKEDKPFTDINQILPDIQSEAQQNDNVEPNYQKWWRLFFGR